MWRSDEEFEEEVRQALREARHPKKAGQAVPNWELQWSSSDARKLDSGSAEVSEEGEEKRLDGGGKGGRRAQLALALRRSNRPRKSRGNSFGLDLKWVHPKKEYLPTYSETDGNPIRPAFSDSLRNHFPAQDQMYAAYR